MRTPKVSILIPVYNQENFIACCIESALAQTFPDIEVVVVDNASTDRTWDICQQFAAKDKRVRIFRNDSNIGPVRNWLACVAKARGEYVKILWSDDLIHPEFMSKTMPYLDYQDVGFVYSSADVFSVDKENVCAHSFLQFETGSHDKKKYIESALLNQDVPYSPGCAIFRTADVRNNLLLNVPNRVRSDFSMHAIGNDLLLFLLTAQKYQKFAVVQESLAYFRMHEGSITTSASSGKISLHYDLAKGYFAEKYMTDKELLKKLNAEFFLHLLRFRANAFGINKLNDFYPIMNATEISWRRVLNFRRITKFILRRFGLSA